MERSRTICTVLIVLTCVAAVVLSSLALDSLMDSMGPRSEVRVDADQGIISTEGQGEYRSGEVVTVTAYVREGYYFRGWYDDDDRLLTRDRSLTIVSCDTLLHARSAEGYMVKVYSTEGFTRVTGGGPHPSGSETVLSASVADGYTFAGWYGLAGDLLSSETTYVPPKTDSPIIAKAEFPDAQRLETMQVNSWPEWYDDRSFVLITDWFSGDYVHSFKGKCQYDISVPTGKYTVEYCARDAEGRFLQERETVTVEGEISQHYIWHSGGKVYQTDLFTDTGTYQVYDNLRISRAPMSDVLRHQFIKSDSPTVQAFAAQLGTMTQDMTPSERADFVLDFVQQNVRYQSDPARSGHAEFWKFPYETLTEHRGDCEDSSILYVSLMDMLGYDTMLLMFVGDSGANAHVAAAVALDDGPAGGMSFEDRGRTFYYCETTSASYEVGDGIAGYDDPHMIPLENYRPDLKPGNGGFLVLTSIDGTGE